MNRHFFYHYFIVCFTNISLLVPNFLVMDRYNGAVAAIAVSPIIGYLFLYLFTNGIRKFPNMGIPEIFRLFYPNWFVNGFSLCKLMITWLESFIVIGTFSVVFTRFLNPDSNPYVIIILLMLACGYGASRSTVNVTLVLEVIFVLSIPIILYIMFKTIANPLISWDAIHVITNHVNKVPTLISIASSYYLFTGYLNYGIYNRMLPPNFTFKFRWVYPIISFFVLLYVFFVPIGFHGTEAVVNYIFLISSTTDSVSIPYGFIERMLFIFVFVLLNLSLSFTMIKWHETMEYTKSIFSKQKVEIDPKRVPKINYIIVGCIIVASYVLMSLTNYQNIIQIIYYFLIFRLFSSTIITIWIFILSKRKRKAI